MGYDEKFFKKSANKKAMYMWLFTAIILSLAYTIELIIGDRTPQYYNVFMILCWVPFLLGVGFLLFKGVDTTCYKETIVIGYGKVKKTKKCPAIRPGIFAILHYS